MNQKGEIPDWIYIDSHTSMSPYWRALCTRCSDRKVDRLKNCRAWAIEHAKECPGATCEVCGTVFQDSQWENCPNCNESGVAGNRNLPKGFGPAWVSEKEGTA